MAQQIIIAARNLTDASGIPNQCPTKSSWFRTLDYHVFELWMSVKIFCLSCIAELSSNAVWAFPHDNLRCFPIGGNIMYQAPTGVSALTASNGILSKCSCVASLANKKQHPCCSIQVICRKLGSFYKSGGKPWAWNRIVGQQCTGWTSSTWAP